MKHDPELLIEMYKTMVRIRAFEDQVGGLYMQGHIGGAVHLYTGEEATAVGVCAALRSDDYISSTHRGHGHCIAKGGDVRKMMAEIFGKATGYCKGKGGSMHIADMDNGILGANGIVGDGIGIAMGAALGIKVQGLNKISVAFFGDGAVSTGIFHESINLASVLKLPVLFVNENNQYAVSTPFSYSSPVKNVADRAAAYGIPGIIVNGNDLIAVYEIASKSIEDIRNGSGPILIEAKTYRWEGHYKGDPEKYRSREEVNEWKKNKDPINIFKDYLFRKKVMDDQLANNINEEVLSEIEGAVAFAQSSPIPDPQDLLADIYTD